MYHSGSAMNASRNMTLDLNGKVGGGGGKGKRARVSSLAAAVGAAPPVLTTPDVQMLKMTSPELAKFLSAGHNVSTPTPFPKTVTEEQELYARGFEDALRTVKSVKTLESVKSKLSGVPQPVALVSVKQEFVAAPEQDDDAGSSVSSSSSGAVSSGIAAPLSPINMEVQESAKLERKRARNREAAARCRKRKLERISNLDERVNELKEENADLASVVKRLRASVCQLKQEVMEHVSNGCQINMVGEEEAGGMVAY